MKSRLTPQKIRQLIAGEYPVKAGKIKQFKNGVMNLNFCVTTDRGLMVFRLPGHRGKSRTKMERDMLSMLAKQGFPCPAPLSTSAKKSLLYPMLPGEPATKATPKLMQEVGTRLGEMHRHFKNHKPHGKRERWEPEDIERLIPAWRSRFKRAGYPKSDEYLSWIESELEQCRIPKNLPRGWTHQDLKPENTLVHRGKLSGILDFDNAYEGALLHDVTTSIMWWCFPKEHLDKTLLNAILKGNESRRKLTSQERKILLNDALRFRLLREMFIGPMTTLENIPFAVKRAKRFERIYNHLFQ